MSSGYRPPNSEPTGRWAQHIHAERKARGWSQTRAFEELREGLGLGARSRAAYIAIDMGKRPPTTSEAEYLASVFGWPPQAAPEPLEATESAAGILAAVRLLVEEIRAERAERREWEQGFLEAMRELATAAAPSGDRAPVPPVNAPR